MDADVTVKWMTEGHVEAAHRNAERQIAEGRAAFLAGEPFADYMPLFWQNGWEDAQAARKERDRVDAAQLRRWANNGWL